MFKNLLVSILYFIIIVIISIIPITILNYYNILNDNIISILKLLTPIIAISISSYILGKKAKEKGYLEGLKIGLIIIITFIIITISLKELTIKSIIYYLILLIAAILSSMIGINKKKQ